MTDYSILHVYTEDNSLGFFARFYENPPEQKGGGGGWKSVPRPQDEAFTAWQGGQEGFQVSLQLLLDQYASNNKDVEHACRTLDKMAGTLVKPSNVQPPLVIIDAAGALQYDVVNYPQGRWVVSDSSGATPTYSTTAGDVLRIDGRRVRQVVTVPFMLYVPYDEATRAAVSSQSAPAGTFTVTSSINTFKKAAAFYLKSYGGASLGNRLAQLNGKRDGTAILSPGSGPYRLPSPATAKQWSAQPRR